MDDEVRYLNKHFVENIEELIFLQEYRRNRLTKLQQEALASAKANAAIEMKWAELLDKDIPQELQKDIQSQMEACNAIISSKDELITDFQTQLRGKDEEYVRTLRQQSEDIDLLISRIRKEFKVTTYMPVPQPTNVYCDVDIL